MDAKPASARTPDGKAEVVKLVAGDASCSDAVSRLPQNLGDTPTEAILIEIK